MYPQNLSQRGQLRGSTEDELHRFFFFFFSNCHSGLLTVCAQARVTPQLKGQTRILKVTLLEPNNPRLRADFLFLCLVF